MHQNLLPNNNDAQSTTKYVFLLRPDAQMVALRVQCTRTALKAPPKGEHPRAATSHVAYTFCSPEGELTTNASVGK